MSKYLIAIMKKGTNKNEENLKLPIVRINNNEEHCFFGYYDKRPFSVQGDKVLYLKTKFSNRMPKKDDIADICIKDITTGIETVIGITRTWNWQQGCMLQWLGKSNSEVIYNSSINKKYISIIKDIYTHEERVIEMPIYSVSRDGKIALSINFDILHKASPGYGYIANLNIDNCNENNGIWLVDLMKNKSVKILSIDEIINFRKKAVFDRSYNYINHVEFNPSANRFVFFHRWQIDGQEFTRMITSDINGKNMFLLADDGMVSHYSWKDDFHILAWANNRKHGMNYYLYKDLSNEFEIVGKEILTEDGHPSFSKNNQWILTDTYPNNLRLRKLILYNVKENKKSIINQFYSPIKYDGPIRCDLHPRWSEDNSCICIDSVHEGKRSLYTINVTEIVGGCNNEKKKHGSNYCS